MNTRDSSRWVKLHKYLLQHNLKRYYLKKILDDDEYFCLGSGQMLHRDSILAICDFLGCEPVDILDDHFYDEVFYFHD